MYTTNLNVQLFITRDAGIGATLSAPGHEPARVNLGAGDSLAMELVINGLIALFACRGTALKAFLQTGQRIAEELADHA